MIHDESDLHINNNLTLSEIHKALREIKNKNSSAGSDVISNQLLINLPPNALDFLLRLFQKCWNSNTIPAIWKESIIVPIHKQGKPQSDIKNYRPIALTSNTCKLFEKIILNRLTHFCDKNNIIPINQAGFRKIDHA